MVNLRGGGPRFPPLVIMITNGGKRSPTPLKLTKQKVIVLTQREKFQNVLSTTFYLVNLRGVGLRFPPLVIMITNGGQRRTIPLKLTKQKVMFLQIFSVL